MCKVVGEWRLQQYQEIEKVMEALMYSSTETLISLFCTNSVQSSKKKVYRMEMVLYIGFLKECVD